MKQNNHLFTANTPGPEMLNETEIEQINMRTMINNISGVMWSIDRNYNLVTSNTAFDAMVEMMTGKKIEKGHSVFVKGFTEEELKNFKQYYDRAFAGETFTIEQHNDTYDRWHDISFYPIHLGYTIIGTSCCSHDITERKNAAAKLFEAKRLYDFSSQINQAIIYTKDKQSLFNEVCSIAINTGKFELACINSIDVENSALNVVACAGTLTTTIKPSGNMTYSKGGPVDTTLLSGKYHVINDFFTQPENSPWRQHAITNNFYSAIVLPIKNSGEVKYILGLFSRQVAHFDRQEIELLEKTVINISFALDTFELEQQRIIAENKLKHQEILNRQAQQIARLGTWEFDFSTGLATWSDEHCRIYGIPENNNVHSMASWLSFIHPEDVDYVREKAEAMITHPQNTSFYYRIVRKDNTVRHIYFENKVEYDAEDIPIRMYGIARDVTDKKKAENKLKHIAARLNQAQAITHLGSWELNFATGIGVWSDECCRIYGLPTSDNIQPFENWMSFIHPEDVNYVMEESSKANATRNNSSIVHRIIRKDGAIRHIHSQAHFEFNSEGTPVGMYGTAHDITEQMANITRLKTQNEQLREIAWIQSHKVRGPLATILGLAQLFNSGYINNTDEIIQGILATSQKLDTVIHEIVDKTSIVEISEDLCSYTA